MDNKSIDRKAAKQFIKGKRLVGKTNQEIYSILREQHYDKKSIALLITSTPTESDIKKYKIYNNILLGLLGITVLYKAFKMFNLVLGDGPILVQLLIIIAPFLNLYFIYETAKYNRTIYSVCSILTILSFIPIMTKFDNYTDAIISFVLCAGIVWNSSFLYIYLFPNYNPKNLKKDSNGEYILAD